MFTDKVGAYMTTSWQQRTVFLALLTGLIGLLSACRPAAPVFIQPPTEVPTPEPEGPIETLTTFYQWLDDFPGSPLIRDAYRVNETMQRYLTPDMLDEIDRTLTLFEEQGGSYDPLTCSQDPPQNYTFDLVAMSEDQANIIVHRWYGETQAPNIRVDMLAVDDMWQITRIDCLLEPEVEPTLNPLPTETVAPADAWLVYENETLGFRLEYPARWSPVENPVIDERGIDPIDSYVIFLENGELIPVALVLSTGSLTDFRLVFPLPEDGPGTQKVVNGYDVRLETHFEGEYYTIIEHPLPDTGRVAIRAIYREGPIPPEIQQIIDHMLETFTYTG